MISVLFIDDEPSLLDVMKLFFEREGEFAVETAGGAAEALEKLRAAPYDAVVADFQMPGMDGLGLLRAIRASGSTVPFILFTGKGSEEIAGDALNSGADGYLRKGGDPRSQFAGLRERIVQAVGLGRRKAEETLKEREETCRALMESAPDMIIITDPDGTIRYANTPAAKMFGLSPAGIVGKTQDDLFSPLTVQRHKDGITEIERTGAPHRFEEFLSTPAGDFWISVSSVPLRDSRGTLTGIMGIARDITGYKQMQDALELVNRKLTILSSATRHDINNKLTVLTGYLQLMMADVKDEKLRSYFRIQENAIEAIVNILKFTKEYEKLGVQAPQWQDVSKAVRRAVAEMEIAPVTLTDTTEGLEVYADPMLERVFYNLTDNAIRHGETITVIRIRYEERGADCLLIFEDNGVGVPRNDKQYLFNRGWGKNTGLGLFLSREILAMTGLEIHETGEEGKGARFEIRVPAGKWRVAGATGT
jgi:PAS domain S-box-containing protein